MANHYCAYKYKYFLCIVTIVMTGRFSAARRHKTAPSIDNIPCSDFVRTSCSTKTTYPTLCLTTLCSRSNAVKLSPKILAEAALSATLDATRSVAATMKHVSSYHHQHTAVKDCLEVLDDSVEELKDSVSEMSRIHDVPPGQGQGHEGQGQLQLGFHMSNVQTWVSAALTDDSTCTDGFDDEDNNNINNNNNKDIDHINIKVVRGMLLNIAQLTSNALALINFYANNITIVH